MTSLGLNLIFLPPELIELGAAESFAVVGGRTDLAGPELTSISFLLLRLTLVAARQRCQ